MPDFANMTISADGLIAAWNGAAEAVTGYPASNIVGRHFTEIMTMTPLSLSEGNGMFRQIMDMTAAGIWSINLAGITVYVNPRTLALLGYSREQVLGKPLLDFVIETEHSEIKRLLSASSAGQSSFSNRRFKKSDGTFISTRLTSSPVTNHRGDVIGHLAVITDLSDRGIIENERDQFFSNSLDMLGIASADGFFLKLNPAFEKTLGWTFEELAARPFLDFVHPEDASSTLLEMQRLNEGLAAIGFENRYRCKTGDYKWLSWRTSAVQDGKCFFVARDVTEQKLSSQRLRKSAEMHSALAELGTLALQKVDLPTVFQHCIELSAKILGFELSAIAVVLPDKQTAQLAATYGWSPENLKRYRNLAAGKATHTGFTLSLGKMVSFEDVSQEKRFDTAHLKKMGIQSGLAVLIPRADGIYGALILHSRAPRRITLKDSHFLQSMANILGSAVERRQLEGQLKTSDRMASVGALAAGVAHEINNPLSYVITNLDLVASLLSSKPASETSAAQILDMISQAQHGAERVRLIVKDLKTFSGSSDDKLEPVKLENIIDFNVRMATNQIRYRAKLITNYGPAPAVLVNENRLGQVILNVLINAAQAIPEGLVSQNEIHVSLGTDAAGHAFIEIRDTGVGIPEDVMPRIFDPFFTTKPVGTGTGLGLSICRNIIAKLNGELSIESRPGAGTKVRIVLPPAANQTVAPDKGKADLPVSLTTFVQRKILILDDEALLIETLGRALASDHVVSTTISPADALRLIESEQEAFDVILCDLMMAEMTGMDFYRLVKSRYPGTESRIVFMTGGTFLSEAQEFLRQVPNVRLEKPFNLKEIRALLQQPLTSLWKDSNEKIG